VVFLAATAAILQTLHVPQPLPALDARVHSRFEPAPGVTAERVSYTTQLGMRIPAIVYLPTPRPAGKIPALIVVNGHGGDKYSWYAFYSGVQYARGGAAVLTYDPIGEGERNAERRSGTRAHDARQDPEELGRRMGGLMITDVMQAVSYLAQRPEIDAGRIGAMGYSMGSFVLSLACAVESRLRACVLSGGGNLDGPGEYWDRSKPMCQGIPYRSLSFLGDRPAQIYALHAARGATLIYNGAEDTVVAMPTHGPGFFRNLQERTRRLTDGKRVFDFGFEEGVSHRPFFVTKPVALWLERELDFPNWTESGIREMPETHISAWAAANGVEMDPGYSNEQREGGTRALGGKVPGLTREQLSVFDSAEWGRMKNKLIYESWLAEARRRVR
jgi:dienelactone hydrolase